MSWLARSIAATLSSPRGEPDPDSGDDEASEAASAGRSGAEESSPPDRDEEPGAPSRGVKDDISELTETLTRRLWGVASFLAPPPPESSYPPAAAEAEGGDESKGEGWDLDVDRDGEEAVAQSPRIAGIRSDLAEFGGRVRSGITMLHNNMAVAEISKIASSLLPFGQEEADEGEPVVGVTEEVLVFVRHIATRPETWLDFPLFMSERYADDFELSDSQYVHAIAMEHVVPSLTDLKAQICSTDMSEACFWKIYFVLLHSKLNKQDADLLSTPQILQAREGLLLSLQAKNGSEAAGESSKDVNVSSATPEEKVIHPSTIQENAAILEVSSFEEQTSDITRQIDADRFLISTSDVEIVDKSVIEEELSAKDETKANEPKIRADNEEDEVDEWPDDEDDDDRTDDPHHAGTTAASRTSLGREEYVSFSDLEDEDDDSKMAK